MRLLAAAAALLASAAAFSQTESEVRLTATLAVMEADLEGSLTSGIQARLLENASVLPLILRETHAPAARTEQARRWHGAIGRGQWQAVRAQVRMLARRYPYRPPEVRTAAEDLSPLGRAIHEQTCAGCHDHPDKNALLPAVDLYALACRDTPTAFAARLHLGVRGMAGMGQRNPFGPLEQAALAAWYRMGGPKCRR